MILVSSTACLTVRSFVLLGSFIPRFLVVVFFVCYAANSDCVRCSLRKSQSEPLEKQIYIHTWTCL